MKKTDREILLDAAQDKKITLLVGSGPTGKSFLANLIGKNKKIIILNGKGFKPDFNFFKYCNQDTELIIIDDLPARMLNNKFLLDLNYGITINKKNGNLADIYPEIIITCDCNFSDIPKTLEFDLNFNVFEIKNCNGIKPVEVELEKLQKEVNIYKG